MNKKQKYIVVTVMVDSNLHKNNISKVAQDKFSCDGIEEYSLKESSVDDILGRRAYSGGDVPLSIIDEVNEKACDFDAALKVYFYRDEFHERALAFCDDLKKRNLATKVEAEEKSWEDWNANWRKHFQKIEVDENLIIVPSWEKSDNKEEEIYIYPGQGFGTGGHETTFLCLKSFNEYIDKFSEQGLCLDLGCGSGILGIAAIKKKNMIVNFCDVDRSALENCLQNLELNFPEKNLDGCSLVLRERFSPIDKKYELIFANILQDVLIREKELILKLLATSGILILSGILNDQADNIVKHYRDLVLIDQKSKGDWSCLTFQRSTP